MEYLAEGTSDAILDGERTTQFVDSLLQQLNAKRPLKRVLIIPPDITRFYSAAGPLTCLIYERLKDQAEIVILPALGTHAPMPAHELDEMFPGIPHHLFREHHWREQVETIGEIPADFIRKVSDGMLDFSAPVQVNRLLLQESWDAIISIGQLVPHEVIGIANHNKNIFVGVGGFELINKSHWLGAVYGMERMMGRVKTPVRDVMNYAAEHFTPNLPIVYLLTVRQQIAPDRVVTRGLYAGDDTACYLRGAELCRQVNLDRLDHAPQKVVVWLDPKEFKSTWLGNKSIYRTRLAVADAGELIVLAPSVKMFGEKPEIDRLIRKYGYRGTSKTLQAVKDDPEMASNLSASAHLIHGSTEGRFSVTYCPGGLTREEIEGVGFEYADLNEMLKKYPPDQLKDGWNDWHGEEVFYVSNPALGLWGTAEKFDR
jgi:nickel-dependent lactate racemase